MQEEITVAGVWAPATEHLGAAHIRSGKVYAGVLSSLANKQTTLLEVRQKTIPLAACPSPLTP
eukprot:403533-Pyramimonas_sp.AAC.1